MTGRPALALAVALGLALPGAPARAGVRPGYGGTVRILVPAVPRVAGPGAGLDAGPVAGPGAGPWTAATTQDLLLARALHAPLLEILPGGALGPGLLAEVPAPEAGGKVFRLRLRAGLQFQDGSPVTAADVALALQRLAGPEARSPHGWIAAPIQGAAAFREGRAGALAGVQVLGDRELLVTLAAPLPGFPWALAAIGAAPVSPRGAGAGPFGLAASDVRSVRLAPNPLCPAGRPFAAGLRFEAADPRAAARALAAGEADLVVRPEAAGPAALGAPPRLALLAAVNPSLGARAEPLRRALDGLDRAALAARFARGAAEPLDSLAGPSSPTPPASGGPATQATAPPADAPGTPVSPGGRITLLLPAAFPEARAVADRIQVKLYDRGVGASVEVEPADRFADRLARGAYDVAVLAVPLPAGGPAAALAPLAAAALAGAARGPDAAAGAWEALAGAGASAVPRGRDLARSLGLVPLVLVGPRVTAAPALRGAAPGPDGLVDPGGLWLLGGGAP